MAVGLFDIIRFGQSVGKVHPLLANMVLVALEDETSGARGITGSRAVSDLALNEEEAADGSAILAVLNGKSTLTQKLLYAEVVHSASIKAEEGTYTEAEWRRDLEIGVAIVPPARVLSLGPQQPAAIT